MRKKNDVKKCTLTNIKMDLKWIDSVAFGKVKPSENGLLLKCYDDKSYDPVNRAED